MIKSIRYILQLFQVKSRMMGDPSYTSTMDCFVKTLKNDVSSIDFLFFLLLLDLMQKEPLNTESQRNVGFLIKPSLPFYEFTLK